MSKILIISAIFIAALYFYARYLESRSVYFPSQEFEGTPHDIKLAFEDVYVNSDKFKLYGWWVPANRELPTLIFCHGNGGNISHRLEKILFFHQLGLNVFIFDYRGYGKSQGAPSEAGLYEDIQAAYTYLKQKVKEGKIVVYGESLGGAIAIDLAGRVKIDGLILEGTFSNAQDMAKIIYPFLPSFLIQSRFDSLKKISAVKVPMLLMHSKNDELVPFPLGRKLFNSAQEPKEFLELEGGHNDAFFMSESKIKSAIEKFLKKI